MNFGGPVKASDADFFLAAPRLGNVESRLHPHKRFHLHAERLLDAKRHLPGQAGFAVQQAGQGLSLIHISLEVPLPRRGPGTVPTLIFCGNERLPRLTGTSQILSFLAYSIAQIMQFVGSWEALFVRKPLILNNIPVGKEIRRVWRF